METLSVRLILDDSKDTESVAEEIKQTVDTNDDVFFATYPRDSRQVSATFDVEGQSKEDVRKTLGELVHLNDKEVLEVFAESEKPW